MKVVVARLAISRLESAITAYAQCQRSEITDCQNRLRRERTRVSRLRAALGEEVFAKALADIQPDRNDPKPHVRKAKGRTEKRTEQGRLW